MGRNTRLREIRENLNFTQEEFGKQVGILQKDISRLERGTAKIPTSLIQYLYKKDYDINWLLTGEGEMFVKNRRYTIASDDIPTIEKERDIEYLIDNKPPASIEHLEKFITSYKKEMTKMKADLERVKKIVLEEDAKKKAAKKS